MIFKGLCMLKEVQVYQTFCKFFFGNDQNNEEIYIIQNVRIVILYQLLLFIDSVIVDCNKHLEQSCCCYLISINVEGSLYFAILDHCSSYLMCIYNGMQVVQTQVICWTNHVNSHCSTLENGSNCFEKSAP